ncbi:RHTO0S26e00188g1_1 [Rhodotorula toruloides]|uniref:RHTO0S26e00188g1_1 n=2 Tax=Rhodotorula toruloides TaxID=5286 RepID=A0A061BH90_RHOTO|nr:uncharacterized protein RHTO_01819 [Rhodotorula toruloides NP11]EMS21353.1 hypothetical protein RHTO_01819 [Rhodotorula toruloides NP11]CDR49361.1 RHTO0S26e00188g1_1 [Rhodotorula toruloides]
MRSGRSRSACSALLALSVTSSTSNERPTLSTSTHSQRMSTLISSLLARTFSRTQSAPGSHRLLSYNPSSSSTNSTPKPPTAADELRRIESRERARERERRLEEDIREAWVWGVW